jgi:outer membrane protein OmpA-like peptidoglycan-associated protein
MKSTSFRILMASLAAGLFAAAAAGTDLALNSVIYPEKRGVDVPFSTTDMASGASLEASVRYEEGQARVDADYKRLAPALAFGGDVSCYVLWAVMKSGTVENLGELLVRDPSGSGRFRTGQKDFAMIVTAEPYPQVTKPSELVVFTSLPVKDKSSKNASFTFSGLVAGAAHDSHSVAPAGWSSNEPIEVAEARRIYELAEKTGISADTLHSAQVSLGQASNYGKNGDTKLMIDSARRSIAFSGDGLNAAHRAHAQQAAAEQAAQQHAQMEALKQQTAESQQQAAAAAAAAESAQAKQQEAEKAQAAASAAAAQAQAEREALAAERDRLQKERAAMTQNLVSSLSKIADTKQTARGIVVTLPGSFFESNGDLAPTAKTAASKLASTALLSADSNIRIEGYSDSSGSEEDNMASSTARAKAVYDYLLQDGASADRMTYAAYGSQYPVASNVTQEGRAQNKRVEVIVARGQVMDAKTFAESQPPK